MEAYDNIWALIEEVADFRNQRHPENLLLIKPNAKESVWNCYCSFNRFCKEKYMSEDIHRLDRHKVCACYILAIIKAGVFDYRQSTVKDKKFLYDEDIAVTVGLSLLRAFIIEAINESDRRAEEKERLIACVDDGIIFPATNHGTYRENLMTELYYTKTEGNYNILSLADTLFLLETLTLSDTVILRKTKDKSFSIMKCLKSIFK